MAVSSVKSPPTSPLLSSQFAPPLYTNTGGLIGNSYIRAIIQEYEFARIRKAKKYN